MRPYSQIKTQRARKAKRLIKPFQAFAERETSGGIILIAATIVALLMANSAQHEIYESVVHTKFALSWGDKSFGYSFLTWINDLLMALFFLAVGLEIKREIILGELRTIRKAALPLFAALGGMIVPALIYVAFTAGTPAIRGWGIPMATDIAFSLGLLALLGSRVPLTLKIFLAAFAIVDDIGALIVIATVYTSEIHFSGLIVAAVFTGLLLVLNFFGVRRLLPYLVLGLGVWIGIHESGVHASIAGVIVAATIPVWVRLRTGEFIARGREALNEIESSHSASDDEVLSEDQQASLEYLERTIENAQMPLQRLETLLHPWVTFFIVPLFAFANSGIPLPANILEYSGEPKSLGIVLGLVLGKPIGIMVFSGLAIKLGLAQYPSEITLRHLLGVALLGGVGFTMSIFISSLAFGDANELNLAKLAIMIGSAVSAILGLAVLGAPNKKLAGSNMAADQLD